MSVEFTKEEKRQTFDSLRQFLADQPNFFEDSETLPVRVSLLPISVSEFEGQCIEWCLQFLKKRLVKRPKSAM